MKPRLVGEESTHYVMHDGKLPFKVPKAGLSKRMHEQIQSMRAPEPQHLAEGGEAGVPDPSQTPGFLARVGSWLSAPPEPSDSILGAGVRQVGATLLPGLVAPPDTSRLEGRAAPAPAVAMPEPAGAPPPAGPSNTPPGVVSQLAPAAIPPPAAAVRPPPVAATRPPQGETATQSSGYDAEKEAATEAGRINEEKGRATAEALVGAQKAIEANALDSRQQRERARMQSESDFARVQAARDALKSTSMTVDPNHYWASQSTGGKILAAVGLALGAIGAGRDGVNRSVGIIENAINRDLEAQKAQHEIQLKKGQMDIESAQSLYSMHRQLNEDDISANEAAKGTALELAKSQVELAAAKASSPMAKAQAQALVGQLSQKQTEHDVALKQRGFENYLQQQNLGVAQGHLRIAQQEADTKRMAEESKAGKGQYVSPDYEMVPGAVVEPKEREEFRTAEKGINDLKAKAAEMKAFIDKTHTPVGGMSVSRYRGADAAKATQLANDMRLHLREAYGIQRLNEGELKMFTQMVPNPADTGSMKTSDASMKATLDELVNAADSSFRSSVAAHGFREKAKGGGSPGGPKTATGKNGERYQLSADGTRWELAK